MGRRLHVRRLVDNGNHHRCEYEKRGPSPQGDSTRSKWQVSEKRLLRAANELVTTCNEPWHLLLHVI
jgi:hypothetical protein